MGQVQRNQQMRAAAFAYENASPPEPEGMTQEALTAALDDVILMGQHDWLIDAVVEAAANGDLLFLQRQVERHVPGWVRP